jgi:hypothetical protein
MGLKLDVFVVYRTTFWEEWEMIVLLKFLCFNDFYDVFVMIIKKSIAI